MRLFIVMILAIGSWSLANAKDTKTAPKAMEPKAAASGTYGVAGCGLGSLAFGAQPGAMQIFAATLNGTGVQTFGITSGTSNCGAGVFAKAEINAYIQSNSVALENDIVRGQGETLSTLNNMLGCDAQFSNTLQKNYKNIYGNATLGTEVSDKIVAMSQSCHG